jgi:hypothetical protein
MLHAKKRPSLLLKIDIAHAFDSVAWPCVLDILRHLGFPNSWLDWISTLLMSASTKPMLNGTPEQRICHARGLHRGDPLSPLLFVLVTEVFDALLCNVDDLGLFHLLGRQRLPQRACLYVDDLVLMLYPQQQDIILLRQILDIFHGASGLSCNLNKCKMVAIRCDYVQR